MRGRSILLTLVLILPVIQPGLSSLSTCPAIEPSSIGKSDGETRASRVEIRSEAFGLPLDSGNASTSISQNRLKIASVCPSFDAEFVSMRNDGTSSIMMRNYSVSDGEGKVVLDRHITLQPDEEVYLCSNSSALLSVLPNLSSLIVSLNHTNVLGRFVLADKGDELLLADTSGVLVDVVAYGDSDYSGTGWEGKPVAKPPKAHEIRRMTKDAADTNTSSDWLIVPPGRSAFSQIATKALVEPFLAPEDARSRLIREFEYSSRSICAAVYELNDPNVVSALVSAAKRGVNVRVLLEGQPVGGISENGRQAASELDVAGVEVSFLKSRDGYKRYDYLHCKYAVIDGRRSIVMSENWVTNGIDRNRGWGVVVESRELASYMARMFWHDCDNRSLDVCPIENVIGERDYEGGLVELGPTVSDIGNLKRFEASVGPLVSPDFSLERLSNLIDSAKSQILVEQFYCAPSWLGSDGLVSGLFFAASKGVTVRILLDSSWFNSGETRNNSKVVEYLNQRASDMGVDLEARLVSKYHPFEMIHNKGVVIDDVSIVSSMNWADASFKENREIGIEIRSGEVSSYFSDAFWEDWKTDPYPPIVNLSFKTLTVHEGTPVWLDASKSTDNAGISRILWDEGADGSVEWDGPRHLVKLGCGNHVIAVAVIDVFNNSAFSVVEIRVLPVEDPGSADVLLLLPFVGTAGFLIWRILKKIKTG